MAEAAVAQLPTHDPKRELIASDVIRLAALWVAAGALYKLFAGAPTDLPPMVRDFEYLSPNNTFRGAIAIELCLVTLAFFRPRTAWVFLVMLFGVFGYVLWPLVQSGAESCGCFGSQISIKPLYMLIADGTFLVSILATRPWSAIPRRPLQPMLLLPLFGLSIWAPFEKFKTAKVTAPPRATVTEPVGEDQALEEVGAELPPIETIEASVTGEEETLEAVPDDGTGETVAFGWQPMDPLPDFHWFETKDWEGQMLFDLDLGAFVDLALVPDTSHMVFYRQTCEHCAEHLEELTLDPPVVPLVLVRVVEKTDTEENKVTHVLPTAAMELELPVLDRGYGIETPLVMDVEGYIVTSLEVLKHQDGQAPNEEGQEEEGR